MYSRILVAVDDSEASLLAMQEAIKMAKNQQALLRIVYVVNEFIPAGEGVPVDFKQHEKAMRKEGKLILNKMLELAKLSKVKAESVLIEMSESNDLVPKKILADAKNWQADLIIIGTHGRRGLKRFLLGSIAEEVIRDATVPVHLVREHKDKK